MLVGETVVLLGLLRCLLLESVKVTPLSLRGLELRLELAHTLAELLGLTSGLRALGRLGREGVQLLLGVDKVKEDIEDTREDEREEESRAGEVDWISVAIPGGEQMMQVPSSSQLVIAQSACPAIRGLRGRQRDA